MAWQATVLTIILWSQIWWRCLQAVLIDLQVRQTSDGLFTAPIWWSILGSNQACHYDGGFTVHCITIDASAPCLNYNTLPLCCQPVPNGRSGKGECVLKHTMAFIFAVILPITVQVPSERSFLICFNTLPFLAPEEEFHPIGRPFAPCFTCRAQSSLLVSSHGALVYTKRRRFR